MEGVLQSVKSAVCSHTPASPCSPELLLWSSFWLPSCSFLFFLQPALGQSDWRGAGSGIRISLKSESIQIYFGFPWSLIEIIPLPQLFSTYCLLMQDKEWKEALIIESVTFPRCLFSGLFLFLATRFFCL